MILSALSLAAVLAGPTDLTFVRHGETVANATGKYNSRTLNVFSQKGQAGVDALTARLIKTPRYDRILVSPSPRALRTIAPYLKATRQKATVWPLLYECCTGRKSSSPVPGTLTWGAKFAIPADIAPYFVIEHGQDRLPAAPGYPMGLRQVQDSVKEFKSRFAGGRVLLVGHSGHGGQFLHSIAGKWIRVENAKEIRISFR